MNRPPAADAARTPKEISQAEFDRFRDYFYRRTGISFDASKRYYVDKRLAERIEKTGAGGFGAYFARLREPGQADEFERLIQLFTINETYFYREAHQFECLATQLLPELTARRPGETLRIWSMPCATGEEPYSIVLYLLENWPQLALVDIDIRAGDIDTAALEAARAGRFGQRALHRLPPALVARYFTPAGGDTFQLIPAIRQAVRFEQVNASSPAELRSLGAFDVIFCRNMLIYFDEDSRRRTVEAFYESLREGGFLCLGHAESMSRISSLFKVRAFPQAVIYQKPGATP